MRIQLILLLAFLFLINLNAQSQNLNITAQFAFGGSGFENLVEVLPSPSGDGYFIISTSGSDISGNKTENSRGQADIWVIRIDNDLNIIWDKTIGGSGLDAPSGAIIKNGKLFIASSSDSPISGDKTLANFGNNDVWLVCLDLNGNLLWQMSYGGDSNDSASKIFDFKNNSLLLVNSSASGISGNKTVGNNGLLDFWLVEVDVTDGQMINQVGIGSADLEASITACRNPLNNHFYLACSLFETNGISGDKTDPNYGSDDVWMIRIDSNLNIIDDKCFGGSFSDYQPIIYENGGNIYLGSSSNSEISGNKTAPLLNPNAGWYDGWLVMLDADMNILYDKTYGGDYFDYSKSVLKNSNGNLALSFWSSSSPSGNKTSPNYGTIDTWLVITNPTGDIIAQQTYGGLGQDLGRFIPVANSDQELLLICSSESGISGNKTVPSFGSFDVWIAKIDASNYLDLDEQKIEKSSFNVYPNPFSKEVNFSFDQIHEDMVISIFSLDGKLVDELFLSTENPQTSWTNNSGEKMFFYTVKGTNFLQIGKIIGF